MKNITLLLKGSELAFIPLQKTCLKNGFKEFRPQTHLIAAVIAGFRAAIATATPINVDSSSQAKSVAPNPTPAMLLCYSALLTTQKNSHDF